MVELPPSLGVAAGCQAPASVSEAHASPGYIPSETTSPFCPQALSNRGQHSISYTLSRSHSVIVEYTHDSDTDMFQVGSGASTSLLATGSPGLDARLCRCPRGRLADHRPGGRHFGVLSAADHSSDEEAGYPREGC